MKNKISLSILLQYIFLFLNPVISIIFIFYSFILNKKMSALVMACSISLIFIYFPLMYDTSSNFYSTFALEHKFYNYNEIRLYNSIALYLKNMFDIDFMYFILITTILSLYIWFAILNNYINDTLSKNKILFLFLFSIFSIVYRDIMDLNRFYFSVSIFLYLLYLFDTLETKKYKLILFIIMSYISIEIHSGSFLFIIIILFVYFVKLKIIYSYWYPIVMSIIGFFSKDILTLILNISFFENIKYIQMGVEYTTTDNRWGAGYLFAFDYLQRIIEIIAIFGIYYLGLKLLKLETFKNDKIIKFILILIGIVLFFSSFKSLYERYSIALFLFSSFIIYKSLITMKTISLIQSLILFIIIIRCIFITFFMFGEIFTNKYNNILINPLKKEEMMLKPFYYFSPYLLDIREHGYSNIYIRDQSTRGRIYLNGYTINPAIEILKIKEK